MKTNYCAILLACLLSGCSHTGTHLQSATASGANPKAACPAGQSVTCANPGDIAITDALRRAILADPAMSDNARNIIIRTSGGFISLKGVVNGIDEEHRILAKTTTVAGIKGIDDQLDTHDGQAQPVGAQ
jgi:osmotically-inducible protein OsmY